MLILDQFWHDFGLRHVTNINLHFSYTLGEVLTPIFFPWARHLEFAYNNT